MHVDIATRCAGRCSVQEHLLKHIDADDGDDDDGDDAVDDGDELVVTLTEPLHRTPWSSQKPLN